MVTALSSSSEKVQCAGGARAEVYALAQAGMFAYAGLKSFRAIQSEDPKDDKQWLTFWLLFSVFELIATVTDVLFGWFHTTMSSSAASFCSLGRSEELS